MADQQLRGRGRPQQQQQQQQPPPQQQQRQQGPSFYVPPPTNQAFNPYAQAPPGNPNQPSASSTTVNFPGSFNPAPPAQSQPQQQFTPNPPVPPPQFSNAQRQGQGQPQGQAQGNNFYNVQPQTYQNQPQPQSQFIPGAGANTRALPSGTGAQFYQPQQHAVNHPPHPSHHQMPQPPQQRQQQPNPQQQQQQQQQGPPPQQQQQHPLQQQASAAMPFVMASIQQMAGAAVGGGQGTGAGAPNHAALGAQLLQTLAPGAAGYTEQLFGGDGGDKAMKSFMRVPKYYFAVNHRYVRRKISLILMPFLSRTWSRQRGMDSGTYDGTPAGGGDGTCYLPPRDDVNAPDLYIPVMSFVTYVLVVGFVFGTRGAFKAEVLAIYFSRGLGVLTMEVLLIKLLLYLINARPTPWLDVIAYRGYKFVGVVLTIVLGLIFKKFYLPALFYSATAMGIFLMRSHRRIILPRDSEMHETPDLARRNAFLLFICVLQYPIYWILARALYVNVKG